MKAVMILSMTALVYIYAGYPLLITVIAVIRNRSVQKGNIQPFVTILISAYNEEDHIERTVKNKLQLSYPADKLQILVVSDGSTDSTDDIVRNFEDTRVRLIRQERAGKTCALNLAVSEASGEILVFADANSIYEPEALSFLVSNFHDPEVGYVTGKMVYVDVSGSLVGDGCSAYMKYENYLRTMETKVHSIVGVDGGIDAMRRSLFRNMRVDQLPDFILPLMVVENGYRVVYEPAAVLRENSLETAGDEYRMRVRVSLRALWALLDMKHLLDIRRYPVFSWKLFSHKVIRYLAFIFLVAFFVSNIFLLGTGSFFTFFFIVQCFCYGAALFAFVLERAGTRVRLFYIPYFFSLINIAAAHAFIKFLAGDRQVIWQPRKGM